MSHSWENQLVADLSREQGQFMVGSVSANGFSVSAAPHIHTNLSSAKLEADRLSERDTKKKFVVLRVEYVVSSEPVQQFNTVRSTKL